MPANFKIMCTDGEGRYWRPLWVKGNVSSFRKRLRTIRVHQDFAPGPSGFSHLQMLIRVEGRMVHSILFRNGDRWDALNGFTGNMNPIVIVISKSGRTVGVKDYFAYLEKDWKERLHAESNSEA